MLREDDLRICLCLFLHFTFYFGRLTTSSNLFSKRVESGILVFWEGFKDVLPPKLMTYQVEGEG